MILNRHIDLKVQLACNRWAILDDAAASRPYRRRFRREGISWAMWFRARRRIERGIG